MNILSIETSCDETALSVIKAEGGFEDPKFEVLSELVASQIDVHKEFGGVVPHLAKREHIKNLPILFEKLKNNKWGMDNIDFITVTVGPGLEPALWTGINFAKEIAEKNNKKLIGVNHLHGHMYSFLLSEESNVNFPAIVLLVSGGHTELILMEDLNKYKKLGETRDDAVGESFDKVARLLGLPYPGGPEIEKLAKQGDDKAINFPMPMINEDNYDFSYSGLKTSVLYFIKNLGIDINNFSVKGNKNYEDEINKMGNKRANIAASFQYSAFKVLTKKTIKAIEEYNAKSVIIGGGVSASSKLREMMKNEIDKSDLSEVSLKVPPFKYCMDNSSMIGVAGYFYNLKGNPINRAPYLIEADGSLGV